PGPTITLPVGYHPKPVIKQAATVRSPGNAAAGDPVAASLTVRPPSAAPMPAHQPVFSPVALMADTQTATLQAHEAFLRFSTTLQTSFAQTVARQTALFQA